VPSGANDRRGIVRRIREARLAYKGPFTGKHVEKVVSDAGYTQAYGDDDDAFEVFKKPGCRPIPINPSWSDIWDDDPTFRCLQRDLGFSRGKLRICLNQARNAGS
jgi:hypothetical protein